ncbi:XRE family transcriptional regulator [Mariprofundus sp. EBB-1]|uniref:helix-turn-helix domain-containing protein n=1 Tax=Mariprofundus sp. EBB-1 TaxID=2650971 RepID=UPI000EF268CD|nr:helix-turn-helix transcriptional regulator [Mariprofundus sp. EBB-1]RLL49139.1 XRE family transcriptional regulator [Mariprofundus sp. EBB-1]
MQSQIGQRIRNLRKTHRPPWTINRLALLANLDPGQLSRAERGLAGLSLDAMTQVANLLGLSLAELIDPENCRQGKQLDSADGLILYVIESIWGELDEHQISQCSKAELELIQHHIRSSIEEGIKRGQIQAEREIEIILNKHS